MEKRPALGKGLSALIPDAPEPTRASPIEVDIDLLAPNDFQPRSHIDDARLDDLAQSIQRQRHHPADRRPHASATATRSSPASAAGAPRSTPASLRVPVVVRDVAPGQEQSLLEMALIENIQREDLNPIEEAHAYRRLADEFHLTQEAIADRRRQGPRVGRQLPPAPEAARTKCAPSVASGRLSMGHARALLALADEAEQRRAARDVIARGLSVRETEVARQEARRRREARTRRRRAEADRRPHARRRRQAQAPPRHARPHRPPGHARADRDRFRVRGRADPHLRPADASGDEPNAETAERRKATIVAGFAQLCVPHDSANGGRTWPSV